MTRAILVLAAGASSRMRGRDKLLEDVDGRPLLRLMAERALAVCGTVYVSLPDREEPRLTALGELPVKIVSVTNPEDGISASINAGVKAAGNVDLMILPADLPEVISEDMSSVWACFDAHHGREIIRATDQLGTLGHPTIIPKTYTTQLNQLSGDKGAAKLIKQQGYVPCPLPENHATTDLDTPEDWENWRKKWGRT